MLVLSNILAYSSLLLLDSALALAPPPGGKPPPNKPPGQPSGRRMGRKLWWQSQHNELSSSETAVLLEECNTTPYDVAIYIDKHVYVAGIPSKEQSSCPLLAMEASDPTWTDETKQQDEESANNDLQLTRGLQKHIHEVSFPAGIDPKKYFDLLPLGTFPLSQLLLAYDAAIVTPVDGTLDNRNHGPAIFSDGIMPPRDYDLVLANCGELAFQIGTNLGVKATSEMIDYAVRRLLRTYEGIADEVRSNPNVGHLGLEKDKEAYDIHDEEEVQERSSNAESQPTSDGIPCGKWYSKDCVGDNDIRYALDASDNLADQAALWTVLPGYYEADSYALGPNGEKIPPTYIGEEGLLGPSALPYSYDTLKLFINITVEGSRYFEHLYQIFPPSPFDFCNETVPPGMTNVASPGECGVNGLSIGFDRYGTSSYERDGSMVMLPFAGTWYNTDRIQEPYASTPVNEKTAFASYSADGLLYQYAMACFDSACSGMSLVMEAFNVSDPERASLIQTNRVTARRIDTADEFVNRINQVYEDFDVLPEHRYPAPMTSTTSEEGACLSGLCPNEYVWCEYDPHCSVSPYQEPAGSIRPGIYVLIVFVVLALNIVVFAISAIHFVRKRENALKEKFALRIAETIKVEGADRVLTAENIAEEFDHMDADGNGMVSKSELFEFIQTGKAGKISERDFNSLFAAIDLDKNGEIDFGEFVTFFKKCQHKYDEVKDQPTVRRSRASYAPNAWN